MNKIYCANGGSNNLSVIDCLTDSVIKTVPVGDSLHALVLNSTGNKIYCSNYSSDNISVIDGTSDSVITAIPVGNNPTALIWNSTHNKIYCANYGSNKENLESIPIQLKFTPVNGVNKFRGGFNQTRPFLFS